MQPTPLMTDVSVTALRQHLPEFLARVPRGERLCITSRGKVVAEISPPPVQDDVEAARALLRGSVLRFDDPFGPVLDEQEWDMLR